MMDCLMEKFAKLGQGRSIKKAKSADSATDGITIQQQYH